MNVKDLIDRIDKRLAAVEMTAAEASRKATGSPDTIRNWRRTAKKGEGSLPTMTTLGLVAPVLRTNVRWLVDGVAPEVGDGSEDAGIEDVPLVSWITAGELADQATVVDFSEFRTIPAVNLPGAGGEWIALKVEPDANSMNKISPPESTIFVDLKDRRLVHNACYIIADESGRATYKRYRQSDKPQFQPASYDNVPPPKLQGAIRVVGRVKRSVIDL